MPVRLSKRFTFEASHLNTWLPKEHPGSRLHGHSYRATITVVGEPDENGCVGFLDGMGATADAIRGVLDHRHLNDIEMLKQPPTLEHLAQLVLAISRSSIATGGTVESATVERPSQGEAATAS